MTSTTQVISNTDDATVSTVLMWILIILLASIFVVLLVRLINNSRGDNKVFYSEKGAINIRVDKLPDIRIATKNCKDFKVTVLKNLMTISYANPFGGVKKFECHLVGDPIHKGFVLDFTEQDFKKLCYHLKPGTLAIHKTKIIFNYNQAVRCRFTYMKKEV